METKSLLYGLIGFFLGGLVVSVAATVESPHASQPDPAPHGMARELRDSRGEEFDRRYLAGMITHHQSALDMNELAQTHALHPELKSWALDMSRTQTAEIDQMKRWQQAWGRSIDSRDDYHGAH